MPVASQPTTPASGFLARAQAAIKPYAVPYYLAVGAVLGAVTTVFVVLTLVIVLIVTNFNVLGFIE